MTTTRCASSALLALLCGRADVTGADRRCAADKGKPLAGKSTLNRLELYTGEAARVFTEFRYATLKTWERARRVIAKAEQLPGKANPRFVVTSLPEWEVTWDEQVITTRGRCMRSCIARAVRWKIASRNNNWICSRIGLRRTG
jgi:hypothetical protein